MIGGWIERSTTPAVYARPIPERSLKDRLRASGVFRVPRAHGSSGALLGWFDETSRGWRTPNSLVLRVDGNGPKFWVFFEYGTQHRLTGGKGCFEGEAYQTTPTKPFPADGAVHRWSLEYDPAGAQGNGLITFVLDGQPWTLPLKPGHKADGAVFNRFGLFNQQLTGDGLEVWFADLEVGGERLDLSREPKWESRGNRTNFTDRVQRPFNDAGWRKTARAGGEPGELGGLFWRDEPPWFLATLVGRLSLERELSASGRMVMTGAAVDSAIYFGWFEAEAKTNRAPAEYRAPARNQLALLIEGPSRVGHYVRPVCSDRTGASFRQDSGPVILPDDKPHEWSLHYKPSGAGGRGEITWRLDDQVQTVPLPEGLRQHGASFDHFGFFNFQPDGAWLEVYVDDLRFTADAGLAPANRRTQDFSTDPGWEAVNTVLPVTFPPRLLQSFGYCTSNLAGESAGELGGYIQNTTRPACCGKVLDPPLTMNDPLACSGTFVLMEGRSISQWITMGCANFGFFNSAEQGWRAKNFVGLRLLGLNEPDGCQLEVYYGTGDGAAVGQFLAKGGKAAPGKIVEQKAEDLARIAPDGKRHHFVLHYDPRANNGHGQIRFTLDQVAWTIPVPEDLRHRGAVFNRFGLFNEQIPGRALVVYFDDLTINGVREDFTRDPGWEAVENGERFSGSRLQRVFQDPVLYGANDFGYRPTSFAGGGPGEIGGRLWRVEEPEYMAYYADRVGVLTLTNRLEARGKIAIRRFAIDSGLYLGWFNAKIGDWPPTAFAGVLLDSWTRGGRFFMPMYAAPNRHEHLDPRQSPLFVDDERMCSFRIHYDPAVNAGRGQLAVTLDGQTARLDLPAEVDRAGAVLNRFGVANFRKGNGKHSEVYLDDLEYTVAQ